MFSTDDTIVAIATPPGRSGLGIVRLSGPHAPTIACALVGRTRPFSPRRATFARLATPVLAANLRPPGQPPSPPAIGDQVVITVFAAPRSYTGQDVVEISAHGSPVVLQAIVGAAIEAGARLAEPGEFTLRAFLNGKLDLIQAEAVADLIDAVTPLQARAAFDQLEGTLTAAIGAIEETLFDLMARLEASLDFADEGYHFVEPGTAHREIEAIGSRIDELLATAGRGRLVREGAQVAILGSPNVGKSSLFNALLNANRAIVTDIPGTTRDLVSERADIRGISVSLVDTAGIRDAGDAVEREGVTRARHAAQVADLAVLVVDGSRPLTTDDRQLLDTPTPRGRVTAINKSDLAPAWPADVLDGHDPVAISATTGMGLDRLIDRLAHALAGGADTRDEPAITNIRHIRLLARARTALDRAARAVASAPMAISEEFLLADLQDAAASLQEITGRRTTEELLRHIFTRFCIGK